MLARVAEIAIPLEIIGNPTRINIADVWIYYPSLGETVDQFGYGGSVSFKTSSVSEYATTTAARTSSTGIFFVLKLSDCIQSSKMKQWSFYR
jgi:hypothetical protein